MLNIENMMEYKLFFGSVKYSSKDDILFGKVEFKKDLISYEGKSIDEIKKSFHEAVDNYIKDNLSLT